MGMIMHDDVPYGEGTSYTQGTGIAINNNVIAVDADNTPTENSEKPVKSKGVYEEIEQIYADNGVLGAKNLLPYPYVDKASTHNGVTYTYDEDGVVTANGTATATSWRTLEQNEFPNLKVGADYILSGCPQGRASDTYSLQLSYDNGTKFYKDTGNGVRFTNTGNLTRIQIIIPTGITANNITFKPMLRLASDPDDTYVPYAMTNGELTKKVFEKRTLTSNDDLNNVTETGIYGVATAPVNSPENKDYYTLIVQKSTDDAIRQLITRRDVIYSRTYSGFPATWSSWYKFTGTVVS